MSRTNENGSSQRLIGMAIGRNPIARGDLPAGRSRIPLGAAAQCAERSGRGEWAAALRTRPTAHSRLDSNPKRPEPPRTLEARRDERPVAGGGIGAGARTASGKWSQGVARVLGFGFLVCVIGTVSLIGLVVAMVVADRHTSVRRTEAGEMLLLGRTPVGRR
jgi:hypothetical protein